MATTVFSRQASAHGAAFNFEYRRRHKPREIQSFKKYMSHCGATIENYGMHCINSSNKLEYNYVPEIHRGHIRTIIKFFGDIHEKRWSMKWFDQSHIFFDRGVLIFKGVRFEEHLTHMDKDDDMKKLHGVIEDIIYTYNHNQYSMPTSMQDLLTHIKNYRNAEATYHAPIEVVLYNHPAILPHEEAVEVIKNFHDKATKHGVGKDIYDEAVSKMERREEYKVDFTSRFGPSSSLPRFKPAEDCLNHRGNKAKYKGVGIDRFVNGEILRFSANMAKHLAEHINKYTGLRCAYKDTDLNIMSLFDVEMLSMQSAIFRNNLAAHFYPGILATPTYASHGEILSRYLINDDSKIESVEEYMSRVGIPQIVETYQVDQNVRYPYVPELHRCHLKSIINFISDLHEKNLSLESLGENNIVFEGDELKFRELVFVHSLKVEDRERDLRFLYLVIKNLLQKHSDGQFPTPITHLLSQIADYTCSTVEAGSGVGIEYQLLNHLAVQPHETAVGILKRFHEKYAMLDGEKKGKYEKAVSEMERRNEYKDDWTRSFDEPSSSPAHVCFHYQPQYGRRNIRGKRSSQQVNCHLLRFCRNLGEHLHQSMGNKKMCNKKDVELVIMAFFDKELLSFYWLTYTINIIPHATCDDRDSKFGLHTQTTKF